MKKYILRAILGVFTTCTTLYLAAENKPFFNSQTPFTDDTTYIKELKAWHQKRIEGLKSENGWREAKVIAELLKPAAEAFRDAVVKRDGAKVTATVKAKPDLAAVVKAVMEGGPGLFGGRPTAPPTRPSTRPVPKFEPKK